MALLLEQAVIEKRIVLHW